MVTPRGELQGYRVAFRVSDGHFRLGLSGGIQRFPEKLSAQLIGAGTKFGGQYGHEIDQSQDLFLAELKVINGRTLCFYTSTMSDPARPIA